MKEVYKFFSLTNEYQLICYYNFVWVDGNNQIQYKWAEKAKTYESSFTLNQLVDQIVALIIVIGSALALWKTLTITFNTECPVVVVLTGSM